MKRFSDFLLQTLFWKSEKFCAFLFHTSPIVFQTGFEEEDALRSELKRVTQINDELKAVNSKLAEQYQSTQAQLNVSSKFVVSISCSIAQIDSSQTNKTRYQFGWFPTKIPAKFH